MELEEVRARIVEILSRRGSATFEELLVELRWEGDLRPLRRLLADMIREGVIRKEPDYAKRKMVYRIARF